MRTFFRQDPVEVRIYDNDRLIVVENKTMYHYRLDRSDITRVPKDIVTGWRKPSSYEMSFTEQVGPFGTWENKRFGHRMRYEGCLSGVAPGSYQIVGYEAPSVDAWLENECIIAAKNKLLKGAPSLGTALGERSETAGQIADILGRLYRGLKDARKGNFKRAFSHLGHSPKKGWDKSASSSILEFNLGIKPLAGDIYASIDYLANHEERNGRPLIKVSHTIKRGSKGQARAILDEALTTGGMPMYLNFSEYYECTVRLYYEPDTPLQTAAQVGLANPAALAWELLPLSFVIDYVVPVGDWLNALNADMGLSFKGGCSSHWRQNKTQFAGYKGDPNTRLGKSSVTGFRENRKLNRYAFETSPVPHYPQLNPVITANRGLNLIALIGQLR